MTMKPNFRPAVMSLAFAMLVAGFGCASKSDSGSAATAATPVAGSVIPNTDSNVNSTTGAGSDYWANDPGASVALTVDSMETLNTYVSSHPINAPTNIRLYVETTSQDNRAGGKVRIGYMDNGQLFKGEFVTQNPTGPGYNRVSNRDRYVGKADADFNQWFTFGGRQVFHGFFQDGYGAVVIVVDGGLDLGDGAGTTAVSGSVWFKNFTKAPAPQFQGAGGEQCWFLLAPSPYECGTFRSGETVVTQSALYPSDGYRRLGTFQGLVRSRGFR